jgi:sugar lactone lactonase YvrE
VTLGSDANNLADGAVMKARLDGSEVVTLVSAVDGPQAVAVHGSHVFWATSGTNKPVYLMMANLDGAEVTTIASLPGAHPSAIAVDDNAIYWTDWVLGTVTRVNLDGTHNTVLASSQSFPGAIAVDATSVYWVDEGMNAAPGSIMKCSLSGTNVSTLAAGQANPGRLAIDATSVYWAVSPSQSTGKVMRVALDGTGVTVLASGSYANPWSIAVNSAAVFWLDQGSDEVSGGMTVADGAVMRVGLDGTAASVVASQQPNPRGIAVDATDVFWASEGTNEGSYADGTMRRATAQ